MNIKSTIVLRPGSADRVVAGHPWIYRGAILNTTHEPKDGEVVQVRDHRRRFLGIGLYNSQSKITVRVLSRTRQEIDTDFFFRRIKAAQTLRTKLLPNANSYRLVSAEGDELSGLIIDKYEDVCSVQISSLGMEQRKNQIYEALNQVCSPSAIVERKDFASRKAEGLETPDSSLKIAEPVGPVTEKTIKVNDLDFNVNFQSGHKTGFYLDQQVNYRLATDLIEKWDSKRILDCFTYQGGFAIHLAKLPNRSVLAIDQSDDAIAQARRNAEVNNVANPCEFKVANIFDWLKEAQNTTRPDSSDNKYDAIILDPPSFTRNRGSIGDALRGYKEIHLRALRLLKERGLLFSYCCSHHVDAGMFEEVIAQAAYDNRQCLRRVAVFHQSPDHPVIPTIPETEYLKGFAYELLPR